MPARRTNGSKYSKEFNNDLLLRTIDVLHHAAAPLTISQIGEQDVILGTVTSQKLARVLSDLCNMGIAARARSRKLNRMVYVSTEFLENESKGKEAIDYV